ncbi:mannosyl-oligosaccharide glucosidase [Malassezia equina]|uniref:Mannosyl-oligosaccharide glucosidase n=1 Tax=Malassezia equina TaxID=1381935 RepID=A0AAF0E9D0_9BASI|nr:mannosyl-oligosaccharide glucosidase [Malassezia equina]
MTLGWSVWLLALCTVASAAVAIDSNTSTVWGTYRPQLFFGLRPQVPRSLVTGLAWFSTADYEHASVLRHSASDNEGIETFKWIYHDGRNFGVQEIVDRKYNYRLETSFVKAAHEHGQPGHWAVRVRGTVLDESFPAALSTFFYVGSEDSESSFTLLDGQLHGSDLGGFFVRTHDLQGQPAEAAPTHAFTAKRVPSQDVWRGKDHILSDMRPHLQALARSQEAWPPAAEAMQLSNSSEPQANWYALQRTYRGNFTYDIMLDSALSEDKRWTSEHVTAALAQHKRSYDAKFDKTFSLHQTFPPQQVTYAREILAQLLGGIGYYHGTCLVDRRPSDDNGLVLHNMEDAQPEVEGPYELLTATPSRTFFPRGFYWDEGFHLLQIGAWDADLSMDLLESWTRLMDGDGWIAREQILGEEARSQVPGPFQTQYPLYANPPTLVWGLQAYVRAIEAHLAATQEAVEGTDTFSAETSDASSLASMYARLQSLYEPWQRHYEWFRRTQRGQIRQWDRQATARREGYRWRGRSYTHVLTSGLDDYPRAAKPHVGELHLDLHAWMGSFARSMQQLANVLGQADDALEYGEHFNDIAANAVDLHWNEQEQLFCDLSVDSDDTSYFECHAGYVSLFPLMLRLLPADSAQLGASIRLLRDETQLWSPHGIRSLSQRHSLFGMDEDYWRGAIWLPINYLLLGALRHYAQEPGLYAVEAQMAYTELRKNVIHTVLEVCASHSQ